MFPISAGKPIEPALQPIADEIEQRTPGLYVVAAQQYRYPVTQSVMDVSITEPRRFNVLEEFILRAALELNPPPTIEDLAEVFGLALIFLEKTFRDLLNLEAVALGEGGAIIITPLGRMFYSDGQVPQPPKHERVYFLHDPLAASSITARRAALPHVDTSLKSLTDLMDLSGASNKIDTMSLDAKREILVNAIPGLHAPEDGKVATSIDCVSFGEIAWQQTSLFLLYDDLEQRWALQARSGKARVSGAQSFFDSVVQKGPEHILDFFDFPAQSEESYGSEEENFGDQAGGERFIQIQELVRETLRQERDAIESSSEDQTEPVEEVNAGSVRVLRNEMIRPEFNKLLTSAQREVIVFSSWITEQVFDADFIAMIQKLAARNVWVLIGHGISRTRDKEDRPIPEAVIKKIHAIRSPQGAPVARVVWLGNSHTKEVVVDRKVYLTGSFNWLSYRGDKRVRRENIIRMTIPEIVADARDEYAELFCTRALEIWQGADADLSHDDALSALGIMGAMGKEVESLKMLASVHRHDLLPDWIRIVTNNLVHGDAELGAICLAEASDLFPDLQLGVSWETDFVSAWKSAIQKLHRKDSSIASDLLHHPAWGHYPRLGLASSDDTPESYLAELSQPKADPAAKQNKKKKK